MDISQKENEVKMSNRVTRSFQNEKKLDEYVLSYPDYVIDYYYSLHLEQRSKNAYVKNVCAMLEYIKNDGINISNLAWVNVGVINRYLHSIGKTKRFGEERQTSISYQKFVWSSLNSFFKYLKSIHAIPANPMDNIQRAKGKDDVKRVYMSQKDIHNVLLRILEYDSEWKFRDIAIVKLLLQTGMRSTALLDIDIKDIQFEVFNKYVTMSAENISGAVIHVIDKNNQSIDYYLTRDTALSLQNWLYDRQRKMINNTSISGDPLFISDSGRLSLHGLEKMIEKYSPVINGKQVTPHKYRATFGTLLYQKTKDIHYVQRQMHHSSADTTQIYVIDNNEETIRASELMSNIITAAV